MELPSVRQELWRWADPEAIATAAALPASDANTDPAEHFLDLPGARIVFMDGVLDHARSHLGPVTLARVEASAHTLGQRATGEGWVLRLDARTAPRRQVRFVDINDTTGAALDFEPERTDDRSWEQKRHDALIDIARDSLKHDDGDIGGVDTTAVIHITAEALATGRGVGYFEGVDTQVSARTAQRIVSCADIIGYVLDGDMQPLNLGPTSRFFTPAQRRAMAARDGGCVWPGCTAPPRWCDAAHITPWHKTRRTDIDNGVLLCHFHHRRYDEDGWTLNLHDGTPWFTPPSHIDAHRTPRQGGRIHVS